MALIIQDIKEANLKKEKHGPEEEAKRQEQLKIIEDERRRLGEEERVRQEIWVAFLESNRNY